MGRAVEARAEGRCASARRSGFSLIEVLVAVAIVAVVAAIAVPVYRSYAATARDGALARQMATMAVFQEDLKLRTGSYGAGAYDPGAGIDTLGDAIGWRPTRDSGTVFAVTAENGERWFVTATDATGHSLCRVFPANEPCAAEEE